MLCLISDDNDNDDGDAYNGDSGGGGDEDDHYTAGTDIDEFSLPKQRTPYRIPWGLSLILSRYLHQGREGISSRV